MLLSTVGYIFLGDHRSHKNKLFSAYCNNIYMCSLWVSYRKRCMRQFVVSYNNSFRIVRSLPMRCSASAMFASSNVDSCQARIRRYIYSLRCRLDVSSNMITHCVIHSDVHVASKLNNIFPLPVEERGRIFAAKIFTFVYIFN